MLKIYQGVSLRTLCEVTLHSSTPAGASVSIYHLGGRLLRSTGPTSPYCSLVLGHKRYAKKESKKLCAMSEANCCSSSTGCSSSQKYSTASSGDGNGMAQLINIDRELQKWKDGVNLEGLPGDHKAVHVEHLKAVEKGNSSYVDPVTGFEVFTILSHLRRGYCCGNACRHCPFLHSGVSQQYKQFKKFNTAFYA